VAGLLYAVAAIAVSMGTNSGFGQYSAAGLRWIALGVLACIGAVAAGGRWRAPGWAATAILLAGVGLSVWGVPDGVRWLPTQFSAAEAGLAMGTLIAISLGAGVGCISGRRRVAWGLFAASVLLLAGLGAWMLHKVPDPAIDVVMFQERGSACVMSGENPYRLRFANSYNAADTARYYGAGVSRNGTLEFGYPYLPLSLLAVVPGYLAGDIRYALVAASLIGAVLIAMMSRSRTGMLAALLLLLTPQAANLACKGWIEPISVALLAGVCYCLYRKKRWLPYALGLLLVSKQYMVVVAPLALLLLDRPWRFRQAWDLAWKATLAGCLVTLPLALWDVRGFWESVVALQFKQPYRPDSLSFLVWLNLAHPDAWRWVPFAAAALAMGAVLAVGRRRAVSFPGAIALALLLFFCLNKQAFGNYYYLVLGSLCCAISESNAEPPTTT
jgi:hypothetical protein